MLLGGPACLEIGLVTTHWIYEYQTVHTQNFFSFFAFWYSLGTRGSRPAVVYIKEEHAKAWRSFLHSLSLSRRSPRQP